MLFVRNFILIVLHSFFFMRISIVVFIFYSTFVALASYEIHKKKSL